jgi:flavin-dependent dehydrogenase
MKPDTFDVAVVGGGPAGCSTAITLAAQGATVVLFEAKTYPHHKVCGEFLSPECSGELDQLGLTASIQALHPVSIETARIIAPDGTAWGTRFPGMAIGLSRAALDAAMARQAVVCGAVVREATNVIAVRGNLTDGFTVSTRSRGASESIRARAVIAAHGKRSALDRTLNRSFLGRPQPFISLKTHVYGPPIPHRVDLYSFPGGYCGMSEVEDGTINVCLLAHESVFQGAQNGRNQGASEIATFLHWMQAENPRLGHWLEQAESVLPAFERWLSIAQVSFARKQTVVDDVLMVGDAAGLIVPLAGDGIAMALQSGRLAGECTMDFLEGRLTPNVLCRLYNRRWQRQFAARLRLGRALQPIMLRPGLLSLGLKALMAYPALGAYLINHTRDGQHARSSFSG